MNVPHTGPVVIDGRAQRDEATTLAFNFARIGESRPGTLPP